MLRDLRGQRNTFGGRLLHTPAAPPHYFQMPQRGEYRFRLDAEIYQAGDLIDSDRFELLDHMEAIIRRPEQPARLEIAIKSMRQYNLQIIFAKGLRIDILAQARRHASHQIHRALQIIAEGASDDLTHGAPVLTDERMQHQCDGPIARTRMMPAPAFSIDGYLLRQRFDALVEQVREQSCADLAGNSESVGIAGRRQPDRQFFLNRSRVDPHFNFASRASTTAYTLAPPQLPHGFDIAKHYLFSALVIIRREYKIICMPPRRERQGHSTIRQVIDHCPLFGDANRIM